MMRAMPIDGSRRDADQRPCSVGPCHKHVAPLSRFHGQQNPHSRLPGPYPLDKEFNWRTVTPDFTTEVSRILFHGMRLAWSQCHAITIQPYPTRQHPAV